MMENVPAGAGTEGLTLERFCSDPAIREAFTDSETSRIFQEIEEDPRKLKEYKGNAKVQRSLRLIHDLLQKHIPPSAPPQQPLQLPGMMGLMTQLTQSMDPMESAQVQGLLGQMAQSQGNGGGQDFLQQMFQQVPPGLLNGLPSSAYHPPPASLQPPTGHPPSNLSTSVGHPPPNVPTSVGHPPPNIPTPVGHPPPNIPTSVRHPPPNVPSSVGRPPSNIQTSSGQSSSGIQSSNGKPPIALSMTGDVFQAPQSSLPPKKGILNENLTSCEDQQISVLPPKKPFAI